MAPVLYYMDVSPPARAVLLTAAAIDLKLELKEVNFFEGENKTPEYLKMNPQHTVPTLEDDGYYLWDSHAIAAYLIKKYGQDDSLYPDDLHQRGTVDQRLHFDGSVLFPRMVAIFAGIFFNGDKSISVEKLSKLKEAFGFLEAFLEDRDWLAGDSLTIADLCTVATASTINALIPLDKKEYPRVTAWLKRCSELPYYQKVNQEGAEKLAGLAKAKMES